MCLAQIQLIHSKDNTSIQNSPCEYISVAGDYNKADVCKSTVCPQELKYMYVYYIFV